MVIYFAVAKISNTFWGMSDFFFFFLGGGMVNSRCRVQAYVARKNESWIHCQTV